MRRLVEPTRTRARLFDAQGRLIADSRVLRGPGDPVQVTELPPPEGTGCRASSTRVCDWFAALVAQRPQAARSIEEAATARRITARRSRRLWGEGGSAVRQRPADRRAGDQRRGSAAAPQAGARRGHAVDQRPRDPRRAAPGAARSAAHLRGDVAGDGAGLALSRQHDRAADPAARRGGAARPRPRRRSKSPSSPGATTRSASWPGRCAR